MDSIRDQISYYSGYFTGRSHSFSTYLSSFYGMALSKMFSWLSLPLPLLSFFALPFFGSTSTSINLVFFYLTWSTLVWSHDPLQLELYGTLAVRILFYVLPSLAFLAFDCALPNLASGIKAQGDRALPHQLGKRKLAAVTILSICNVLLGVLAQASIELVVTRVFHLRSALRISSTVPMPWGIARDLLRAFLLRGLLHYPIHRYLLHQIASPVREWHNEWQHGIRSPFSIAANYDHPLPHLLANWLPLYVPAVLFRFHVLTWLIFLALSSLEEAFTYSGYAVLPSGVMLAGMARRTDSHFEARGRANYGRWGLLDWVCGTGCKGEGDVVDNLREEVARRGSKRRASDVVADVLDLLGDADRRRGDESGDDREMGAESGNDREVGVESGQSDDAVQEEHPEIEDIVHEVLKKRGRKGRNASVTS
ncbi:hypothetical protein LTR28_008271 [Elasticomyces elasticus]|nr:hypothetical protein LTR28_008271 [Elasticomyces elasticus]